MRTCERYIRGGAIPGCESGTTAIYSWCQTRAEVIIHVDTPGSFVYKRDVEFKVTQSLLEGAPAGRLCMEPVAKISLSLAGKPLLHGSLGGPIEIEEASWACTIRRNRENSIVGLLITLEKQTVACWGLPRMRQWSHCVVGEKLRVQCTKPARSPPVSLVKPPTRTLSPPLAAAGPSMADLSEDALGVILAQVLCTEREREWSRTQGWANETKLAACLSLVCRDFYRAVRLRTVEGNAPAWCACVCCLKDLTQVTEEKWTDMPFVATPEFANKWGLEGKKPFTRCPGHATLGGFLCPVCLADSTLCTGCDKHYCEDCWGSSSITCDLCDNCLCGDRCYVPTCSLCSTTACEGCADMTYCNECELELCSNCRDVHFCDCCCGEVARCESCGPHEFCDRCECYSCETCITEAREESCCGHIQCASCPTFKCDSCLDMYCYDCLTHGQTIYGQYRLRHTHIRTYMHTCMHTYMHTYIHAYIHTCMHTYTSSNRVAKDFINKDLVLPSYIHTLLIFHC